MTVLQRIKKKSPKLTVTQVKELRRKNIEARKRFEELGGYEKLAEENIFKDLPQDVKRELICD